MGKNTKNSYTDNDDLFEDKGPPLGSDPFELNEIEVEMESHPGSHSQVRDLNRIANLFLLVNSTHSFAEICSETLHEFTALVQGEMGAFFEWDRLNKELFYRSHTMKTPEELARFKLTDEKGPLSDCLKKGKVIYFTPDTYGQSYLNSLKKTLNKDIKNILVIPILIQGTPFGVIEVYNIQSSSQLESVIERVLVLAHFTAILLEDRLVKASLTKNAERKNERTAA